MKIPSNPDHVVWNLGSSAMKRPLDAVAIAPFQASQPVPKQPAKMNWPWLLFLGGVHGDEKEGVWLVEEMRARWTKEFSYQKVGVILWARMNADGVARDNRWNGHNVDLNRNLPTKDWTSKVLNPRYPPGPSAGSEPENQALIRLIQATSPLAIFSAHSFSEYQVNCNGPSREWGEVLGKVSNYPVTEDIGYPTPGSLGTYAGTERSIPAITYELERGLPKERVLAEHVKVAEAAVAYWEGKLK